MTTRFLSEGEPVVLCMGRRKIVISHAAVASYLCLLSAPIAAFAQFDEPQAAPPTIFPGLPPASPSPSSRSKIRLRFHNLEAILDEVREQDPDQADKIAQELLDVLRQYEQQVSSAVTQVGTTEIESSRFQRHHPRVEDAQELIDQLRATGAIEKADQFEERLEVIKKAMESKEIAFAPSETPEVHRITLTGGTTLPQEYRTAENRLCLGYAEVHLRHHGRPITMILSTRTPMLWKIVADPGVRVHAIILDSPYEQRIVGLDNPLVLETADAQTKGLLLDPSLRQSGQFDLAEQLAGGAPVTHYVSDSYRDAPIVIGPPNESWLGAYLVPDVETLIAKTRQVIRQRHALSMRGMRFKANFANALPSLATPQTCLAEFTLVGPIARTMVPLSDNTLRHSIRVGDDKETIEFGLTTTGQLVTVNIGNTAPKVTPVPLSSEVFPSRPQFQSLIYDSRRHRLLLATKKPSLADIVAFDITAGVWSKLTTFPEPVIGMTYIPAEDQLWSLLSVYSVRDQVEYAEFVVSNAETGVTISRKKIGQPLLEEMPGIVRSSYPALLKDSPSQLVEANGRAVLVSSHWSCFDSREPRFRTEIFVIDPNTCDLLYKNAAVVNQGEDPLKLMVADPEMNARSARTSVLSEIDAEFVAAREAVEELSQSDLQKSLELSKRLQATSRVFRGTKAKLSEARMYLVGRYSATQPMTIRVEDTSGPVVLAVCGQHQIDWKIEISEGVQLTRIIAAGIQPQTLSTVPANVPVDTYSGNEGFSIYDARNLQSLERVEERLAALTGGLKISASSLTHRSNDLQIVGPQDGSMRMQLVKHELERIIADANAKNLCDLVAALEQRRFHAIHQGALPTSSAVENREPRYWNEYSIHGPLIGRSVEVSNQTQFAAQDRQSNRLYLVSNSMLTVRDLSANTTEEINLRQKSARLGQISGVAFDTKQSRILIDSNSGLFAYDLKSKQVETVRDRKQYTEAGFAYSQDKSLIYAAQLGRAGGGDIRRIQTYNEHGAILGAINLSKPFSLGRQLGSGNTLQLIDLDEYLALVNYRADLEVRLVNGNRTHRAATGRIMVVEVESGKVVYESRLQPTVEPREISQAELSTTWHRLGDRDLDDLDTVMWSMAAGGGATYEFLLTKYTKRPAPLDEVEIATLLKGLDSNRFSVRNQAFQKLQKAGSSIEPVLKQTVAAPETSSEVRERLRSLFEQWNSGKPQTGEQRRQIRGLEVLSRIGSQNARQFLRSLQGNEYDSMIRRYAEEVLDGEVSGKSELPVLLFPPRLFVPR